MNTPFSAKLRSNYCPTDAEISQIETLLVEPLLRLKQLDDEIADLQAALDKIKEERDNLGAEVDAHKALLSPFRRLPLDIVQEIFIACLPSHRNCVMSATEAPLLLGRVCSAWRTLSHSTPRLWASLHVVEPARRITHQPDELLPLRLEATKSWLSRAASHPLSISFDGHPVQPLYGDNNIDYGHSSSSLFLREFIPFAAQWEDIDFFAPPSGLQDIESLVEADVPLLKRVSLHYPHDAFDGVRRLNGLAFLGSSRISSLSLSATIVDPTWLHNFQWDRLTVFSMTRSEFFGGSWKLEPHAMLAVILRCPALRSCTVAISAADHGGPPSEIASVELPLLHTLEVTYAGTARSLFDAFLCRLYLPALVKLHLRGQLGAFEDGDPEIDKASRFFAYLTRLEDFSTDFHALSTSLLVQVLPALPSTLRTFRIRNNSLEPMSISEVLLALATSDADSPNPVPCPGLRHLEIQCCRDTSDEAVLEFLMARAARGVPLKQITIDFQRGRRRDILSDLQVLVEDGLEVVLKYWPSQDIYTDSVWRGLPDAPRPPDVWYD